MWALAMIVVMLFVPALAAVLTTKSFRPAPTVGPARGFVTGIVLAGGGLLVASMFRDWWVFHATEYSDSETANGGSTFVRLIVTTTALCTALTLLSLWGRRNLAFLGLPFAWVLVGLAWIWVTGGLDDAHSDGETQLGLTLAIWSLLPVTSAALAASAIRRSERRDPNDRRERVTRIELALAAWEAAVLPLNYTRRTGFGG